MEDPEFLGAEEHDGHNDADNRDGDLAADFRQGHSAETQERADDVHQQDGLALRETEIEQTVMEMSLIRLEDWHAAAVAAHDGERRVEDWQAERQDRHDQRDRRGALDGADDRDAREHEAEELAARIAHEDLSRIEVVVQEAERCAGKRGRQHGDEDDALLQCHEEDRDGRDRRDACGEAVEAVDEVDRIRQADEPEDRRRDGEKLEVDVVAERVRDEIDADIKCKDEHAGRDDLAQELHLGRQVDVVVDEADDEDDRAADQEANNLIEHLRRNLGERQDAEDCHHEGDVDADAADARDWLLTMIE